MIYPEDLEVRLGFDQVRQKISNYCVGESGKDQVAQMSFSNQFDTVMTLLKQTHEMLGMFQRGEDIPIESYDDPEEWFHAAAIGENFLETDTFIKIARTLQMLRATNQFLLKRQSEYPVLGNLIMDENSGKALLTNILSKIDEEARVRDNATSELSRIRKKLREEILSVRKVADTVMRTALEKGWSPSGSQPTVRDGRLVIPILAEFKRKIRGYVIDQSSTGQTVYLEPGEVMEANNDLRELQQDERKEVVRILKDLTSALRQELEEIRRCYQFIAYLDFIRAKAKYAQLIQADLPVVQNVPCLQWIAARHPLLFLTLKGKRSLVPLNIHLNSDERFLLVSGPNAGGKSVCLKTVGLLQYMLQCGLLVPLVNDSVMGIFSRIFLDIGDQQSIENDLSTYSSHLKNMDFFIRHSSQDSLALMDELGSGTDPNFGGGLAQAILQELVQAKAWGIATTHYYNLKVFAENSPGIGNAAMKFDSEHLVPLFQLEIGQPGSSYALEIARKTGLSESILKSAEAIIGKDLTGLESLMKQVQEEKQKLEGQDKDMIQREHVLKTTLQKYESLISELEKRKKEIINTARMEASTLLQQTNREIEKTIRHIRENKAEKSETRKVRSGLKELEKKVKPLSSSLPIKETGPLAVGDKVRIIGGDVTGTVLSVKGKNAMVQFGDLRSNVKLEKLVRSDGSVIAEERKVVRGIELHQRMSGFSPVLDIRGVRLQEVVPLLTRFVDDAVLLNQSEIRIIHGKGEGVLRKAVREYLKKQRAIAEFRDEHADRGGDGLTIATLK